MPLTLLDKRTLLDTGSAGNPLDILQASYTIFEGLFRDDSIQFVRVPYDIEQSIRLAREADMPDIEPYANELRTAIYRGK